MVIVTSLAIRITSRRRNRTCISPRIRTPLLLLLGIR